MKSLELATRRASESGDVVLIAPEGTRSPTGQLLPFKKGAFYMWESINKKPIIPMVIYGGFELHPPGMWNVYTYSRIY